MKPWSKHGILGSLGLFLSLFGGLACVHAQESPLSPSSPNSSEALSSRPSSKMNYGRFLEYLDMGWVQTVDFYENGRMAVIEASSPELGNRSQKIRVEIPVGASPLIRKLREAKVDFTTHPAANYNALVRILSSLFLPFVIVIGFVFLLGSLVNLLTEEEEGMSFQSLDSESENTVLFNDVAGIDEAKEEFEEIVSFLKNPQPFTAVGAKIPKGVLLVGPPGTGKTLLAKAIAGEAGVPFISSSGSEFVEMFVGVGASRVRDLFNSAKKDAPCIIFIDEIDAVGRQRGFSQGSGNEEREQTLNQILTEMDGFQGNTGVIVIAATNRVDVLDAALLRPGRFDRQVQVGLPDVQGRLAILKVHGRNKKMSSDVVLERIAQRTPGFSGADLANLLNEAAILTARRNQKSISMWEVNTAIDRVMAGLEGTALTDTKNKRLVAYHEVGHALLGSLLEDHDNVQKVTLLPRGEAKGLTWFAPKEDQFLVTRRQLTARLIGSFGGRAAEEIVFGTSEMTTAGTDDLEKITSVADQMVCRYGMSRLGPLSLESDENENPFDDDDDLPEEMANKIDREVRRIIQDAYDQAITILKENRSLMDKLVNKLVEEETIDGNVFLEMVKESAQLPGWASSEAASSSHQAL